MRGKVMHTRLQKVEGIGEVYADKLHNMGIDFDEELLLKGANPQGRQLIEKESGINHRLILEWINHVDLFRIKGVSEEYADLLEATGIDSVIELARRTPKPLYDRLKMINTIRRLVRRLPSLKQVTNWIKQAKKLPRIIKY